MIQNSPLFYHHLHLKLTIYKRSEFKILRRTLVINIFSQIGIFKTKGNKKQIAFCQCLIFQFPNNCFQYIQIIGQPPYLPLALSFYQLSCFCGNHAYFSFAYQPFP